MESRYLTVTNNVTGLMEATKEEVYQGCNFKIKILFDTKQRKKKGKLVLASTEIMQEKLKFLLAEEEGVEYDFLTIIDAIAWEYASDSDKVRLLRHELNHMHTSDTGKLQIVSHDVSDFYAEIQRNTDSKHWNDDLTTVVEAVYEQEKEK